MELTPIFELGVDEAYAILAGRFGQSDLPPLDAIENEDWGRDLLLSRFESMTVEALAEAGLSRDRAWDRPEPFVGGSTAPGSDHARGDQVGPVVGHNPEAEAGLDRYGQGEPETEAGADPFVESA
jgi:hypothetical protein